MDLGWSVRSKQSCVTGPGGAYLCDQRWQQRLWGIWTFSTFVHLLLSPLSGLGPALFPDDLISWKMWMLKSWTPGVTVVTLERVCSSGVKLERLTWSQRPNVTLYQWCINTWNITAKYPDDELWCLLRGARCLLTFPIILRFLFRARSKESGMILMFYLILHLLYKQPTGF